MQQSLPLKRIYLMLLVAMATLIAHAAAPNGSGTYYSSANGKQGAALKTALCGIIYSRTTTLSYAQVWTALEEIDVRNGKIWDMYSTTSQFTPVTDRAGSYQKEGDVYNREHSFPNSWFGGEKSPMYTDLHHVYPTDGFVNNKRANYPFGETNGGTYQSNSSNGVRSKLGTCTYPGYSGVVFEPIDEYKGDFARTYFYMVTCYENQIASWFTSYNGKGVEATLDGNTYPGLQTWQLNMLMQWAQNDPVSDKETARNNAVYNKQGNRNPFIDYPGLERYIWGDLKTTAFSYNNYVEPEGSGSGTEGGGSTTGEAGTYKLTITTSDFNSTSYAANNNEKTSQAVCTTDASKTYEVTWSSNQVMLQSNNMQWQKNTGYIYNSTDLGTITNVTVTSSEGTFTTYYGTSAQPSSSTTVGNGYFQIKVGNATGKTSKVEITFTIEAPALLVPSFDLTDLSVDYGSSLTLTKGTSGTPNIVTDGEVTLTSSNTDVVTVNGLTITPVAVGTAVVTVNTAEGDNYSTGSTMFPITVNAPEGKTEAMAATGSTVILDFNTNSWGIPTANTTGQNSYTSGDYTITLNASSNGYKYNNSINAYYLLLGKSGATLTLPAFDKAVTQIDVVGKGGASSSVTQNIYVGNTAVSTKTTGATGTNSYAIANGYQAAGNIYTLKVTNAYNTQITSIVIHFAANTSLSTTLNTSGYATYCSEYPLDFTNAEGYTAWQVTGISGTTITFSQVTGAVKGGTGLLLMGESGATVALTSAASTTELSENMLYGTLAPTYVAADEYYGLKDDAFVPVNAGTVPAGKALLPIPDSEVKAFTFIFDGADGIKSVEKVSAEEAQAIFNLAGQRLQKVQRGVNIIGGRKVIVK